MVSRCCHPVCGEFDVTDFCDTCRCDIGDRLAHRHTPGCRCIEQRQRCAFTQCKGLAQSSIKTHQRDGHVGHRHLPRAHHLVTCSHATHAAIANSDQETLVSDRWQTQHAGNRLLQLDFAAIQSGQLYLLALDRTRHFGRLAQQYRQRHIHRIVPEQLVMHDQPVVGNRMAQHRKRTAFACTNFLKCGQTLRCNGQHISFLRFVTPDLHRRHAALFRRHFAQLQSCAAASAMHQLRQRIGDTTGTHIMYRQNKIVGTHLPAAVYHLLRTALHFRIATLNRVKIQILRIGAGIHTGSRAAAETDQHAGATQLNQQCAHRQVMLVCVLRRNVTNTASQHDRLVIAAHFTIDILFKGTEIAGQNGASKFIIERRTADGTFQHNLQRGGDARWLAVFLFLPRLHKTGNRQI